MDARKLAVSPSDDVCCMLDMDVAVSGDAVVDAVLLLVAVFDFREKDENVEEEELDELEDFLLFLFRFNMIEMDYSYL
jgi:hypothetical protein